MRQSRRILTRLAGHPACHLLALATLLSLLVVRGPVPAPAWSQLEPPPPRDTGAPLFQSRPLTPQPSRTVHAGQAVALPDGRLVAFWFGGTREAHPDVQIYRQVLKDGQPLGAPEPILSAESLAGELGVYVKMLGNPVPYYRDGELHLFVVSVALGGWATAQVNHLVSDDLGASWRRTRQLITSPFFNMSTLVRTAPKPIANGLMLPAYFEQGRINPMWLQFNEQGDFLASQTLVVEGLQPDILLTGDNRADLLIRPVGRGDLVHRVSESNGDLDRPPGERLSNPSSAVSALALGPDEWLLAHNPGDNRSRLAISHTRDGGASWETMRVIAEEPGERFSYPHLTRGADGYFHLLYTHKREHIQYLRFNLAGLRSE